MSIINIPSKNHKATNNSLKLKRDHECYDRLYYDSSVKIRLGGHLC